MSVKIIIDSASEWTKAEAEEKDLMFLPLSTTIDGTIYQDGVNVDHDTFYELLKTCQKTPTTSQLRPIDFENAFRKASEEYDEILVITMSAKLSGTYQSAAFATKEWHGNVFLVDSNNVSIGEQILIRYAVKLRDAGMRAAEIAAELELVKNRIVVLGVVDTLEYLFKGGRLSRTSAIAGTMLKIKPILGVVDGEVVSLGKAHGAKQSCSNLNRIIDERGGIDFSMPLMLAYSGTDDALLQQYIHNSKEIWQEHVKELPICTVGSTIGTHVGPGAIILSFFADQAESND